MRQLTSVDVNALMTAQTVSAWLRQELKRRQEVNPRYSLRRFAAQLRVSPGTLSEVLSGKRVLGIGVARRISNALELGEVARSKLMQLIVFESDEVSRDQSTDRPVSSLLIELGFEPRAERAVDEREMLLDEAKRKLLDAVLSVHPDYAVTDAGFWAMLTRKVAAE